MNPSPVLRMRGTVHTALMRTVQAVDAAPAERDEQTGRVTREAREAREAYDVLDVSVLTSDGGFATVLVKGEHLEESMGGVVPDRGAEVDWPVRCYVRWAGNAGRRFPVVGYSVAGDVLAEESSKGRRVAPVAV